MKYALMFMAVCAVVILNVECTSPPRCTGECDKNACPSTDDCKCGTYPDMCNCCDYCLKCPGEDCSFIANERCTEGYTCTRDKDVSGPDYYNKPGVCTKTE